MSNQLSRDELLANLLERQAADLAEREARLNRRKGAGKVARTAVFIGLLLAVLVGGFLFFRYLPSITKALTPQPSFGVQQQRPYVPNVGSFVQTGAAPQPAQAEPPAPGKQAEGATNIIGDMPAMQPVQAEQPEGGKVARPEAAPQGKAAQPEQNAPVVEQLSLPAQGKSAEGGALSGASSGIGGGARP